MRVILDLRSAHQGLTGIGRYAANLALSLERLGGAVEIVSIATRGGDEYLQGMLRSEIHVVDCSSPGWDDFRLPGLLQELGADVYHTPLFILPAVRTCSYVSTIHDVIPLARPDLTPAPFMDFFKGNIQRGVRRAEHVITVSEHSRQDIHRYLEVPSERVTAVYEPVSPLFRMEGNSVPLAARDPRPFILYVGAWDRRKNLDRLLDAYMTLESRVTPLPELRMVGAASGDGYDLERAVSVRRLEGRVRLLGRISDARLAELYRTASLFVFPSLYEGFGLPVVEAMASGTPVVTSRTTSLPEVAGDAAILVDPESVESISQGMNAALSSRERQEELHRKGLERAARFSLERQGKELLEIYSRLRRRAS